MSTQCELSICQGLLLQPMPLQSTWSFIMTAVPTPCAAAADAKKPNGGKAAAAQLQAVAADADAPVPLAQDIQSVIDRCKTDVEAAAKAYYAAKVC